MRLSMFVFEARVPLMGTSGQANHHCVSTQMSTGTDEQTNSDSSFSLHILRRPTDVDKAREYTGIITKGQ